MEIKIKNGNLFNIQRDTGVYLIRCIPNGRIYIGSTKQNFRARFSNHCKFLSKGKLSNKKLQPDFTQFGPENFEFEILGTYPEHLTTIYEKKFIEELKPYYNIAKACNNSRTNLGKKFTKEHVEKIRKKAKLFKHQDLEKISKQNKEGASKFEVINLITKEKTICNSTLELISFLETPYPQKYYNKVYKDFFITVLKTQKKRVKLLVEGKWIEFTSYEKCDKFLNKWRGFTSTQSLRQVKELMGYRVKF